jgi:hypothetical protein
MAMTLLPWQPQFPFDNEVAENMLNTKGISH